MPKNITTSEGIALDPKCLNDLRRGDKVWIYIDGNDHLFSIMKFRGKCCIGKIYHIPNYYSCDICNKKIHSDREIYTCNGNVHNDCNFHTCLYCKTVKGKTCPKNHTQIKCKYEIVKFPKWSINMIYHNSKSHDRLEELYSLEEYVGIFLSNDCIKKLPKHWV